MFVVTVLVLFVALVAAEAIHRRFRRHHIVDPLIAFHRQAFGSLRMEDDGDKDGDGDGDDGDGDDGDKDGDGDGDTPLGPKGERALQAEKDKRREAVKQLREWKALGLTPAQVTELQTKAAAKAGKSDDGDDDGELAAARQKAVDDAIAAGDKKANAKILRSEIKLLATGKLANPKLALQLLDLSQFEVDDDGNVDEDEIVEALDDLLKKEPYLAAQGRKFQGDGDGGPRGDGGKKPKQLTAQDVKSMTPEQVVEAQQKGQLVDYLAS